MNKLEKRPKPPDPEKLAPDDVIREIGTWFWVKSTEGDWLGCITFVGSNYVEVSGVSQSGQKVSQRIHEKIFDEVLKHEPNYEAIIKREIDEHKGNVDELMNKVKQLTSKLGIFRAELTDEASEPATNALVVAHGTKNIQAHKRALIKAKEETLPNLFKQIETEHQMMAAWMKSQLIPMKAEADVLQRRTGAIEDRIFTVELYAGLVEELVKIQDGKPAGDVEKIHLMQRRCYMDEECLYKYEAGGMDYKSIKAFDAWLVRPENLHRILPHPRCIVSFRIRRRRKDRNADSLSGWIRIHFEEKLDKETFLYIRNGEQVYRLTTKINFGPKLFPDREQSTLLSDGSLWIDTFWQSSDPKVYTTRERDAILTEHEEEMAKYHEELAKWKKAKKGMKPWEPDLRHRFDPLNPDNIYYDDAMRKIARRAIQHNRVAVVLQGLLDRSPAFQPHPPWQLWTPEGFMLGIELVYDATRVLTTGEKPDFLAYVAKLNESLVRGSFTIGQERIWAEAEAVKESKRYRYGGRDYYSEVCYPYGNPGPGLVAKVIRRGRDGSCAFEWKRDRQIARWVDNPERPGYMKRDYDSKIRATFTCPAATLMNVSAYKPGDFRQFFADPRTRAEYLRWAPFLLAAEDWHAGKLDGEHRHTGRLHTGDSNEDITTEDDEEDDN